MESNDTLSNRALFQENSCHGEGMVPECPHHCYWRPNRFGTWGMVNNRISYAGPSNGQLHTSDPPGHPRGRGACPS